MERLVMCIVFANARPDASVLTCIEGNEHISETRLLMQHILAPVKLESFF